MGECAKLSRATHRVVNRVASRTLLRSHRLALLTALGLTPVASPACSGTASSSDGSAGAGGSATGSGGTGAGGVSQPSTCANPVDAFSSPPGDSGFDRCEGGYLSRRAVKQCDSLVPRPERVFGPDMADDQCVLDADCEDRGYGYCTRRVSGGGGSSSASFCEYGCTVDADCAAAEICLCGDPVGKCVPADCTTAADCPGDSICASHDGPDCEGPMGFACTTPQDECTQGSELGRCVFREGANPLDRVAGNVDE